MEDLKERLRDYYRRARLKWPLYVTLEPEGENLMLEVVFVSSSLSHVLHLPAKFSLGNETDFSLEIAFSLAKIGETIDPCLEDFCCVTTRTLPEKEAERRRRLFSTFSLYPGYIIAMETMLDIFGLESFESWLKERFASVEKLRQELKQERTYLISNTLLFLSAHSTINEIETWFSLAGIFVLCERLGISSPEFRKNLNYLLAWDKEGVFEQIVSLFYKIPTLSLPKVQVLRRMEFVISQIFEQILEESWHPKIIFLEKFSRNVWSLDD